jgi:hypothetical protein
MKTRFLILLEKEGKPTRVDRGAAAGPLPGQQNQ